MPAGVACTIFRKNPTFKTIVMLLRSLETLNRVFSISPKWDLPGSSTKLFSCPNRASGGNDKSGNRTTSGRAHVNCCTTVPRIPERVERVVANDCAVPIGDSVCESVWEYGEFPVVETSALCASTQRKVKMSPLRYIDVMVNGKAVRALKDTGAQIPFISQNLSQEIPADHMGRIMIDGVVGSALVPLTNVDVQLDAEPGIVNLCATALPVVCAVVDLSDKEYDMILPADVVKELQQMPVVSVLVAESTSESANMIDDVLNDQMLSESKDTSSLMSNDDVTNAEFCNNSSQSDETMNDDASKLIGEQQSYLHSHSYSARCRAWYRQFVCYCITSCMWCCRFK